MKLNIIVPTVPQQSVDAAKRMAERHPDDSDECKLAGLIIELADTLASLNSEVAKSRDDWDEGRGESPK